MDYSLLIYFLKKPDIESESQMTRGGTKQTLVIKKNERGEKVFELQAVSEALPSSSSQAL